MGILLTVNNIGVVIILQGSKMAPTNEKFTGVAKKYTLNEKIVFCRLS